MKAIAIFPGKIGSAHLREIPKPKVEDAANGRGVLVKVLRVGVDGTDKEIDAAEYGTAPKGSDFLVTGHESFGIVESVGKNVSEFVPGDFVVATVRRPGNSIYDRIGTYDMTLDEIYYERGINLLHGYLTEYYVDEPEYIVKVPQGLKEVGVLLEPTSVIEISLTESSKNHGPFDLIFEATGFAPLAFEAMNVLGKNGVLVLSSVTGGGRNIQIPADQINLGFVLGNKVMVGTVNANREYFEMGVKDLSQAELTWPGWLNKLLTHPIQGLENYKQLIETLKGKKEAIKVFCEVAPLP